MFADIYTDDFSQQALYDRLVQDAQSTHRGAVGAIVTFTGLVRDNNASGRIDGIELEHYPGMTESALLQLAQATLAKFSLGNVGVVHRVGRLHNDEQIVWVGCCASHRKDAFDGACYLMDMLKKSVPLWKKEFTKNGEVWVDVKATDEQAALAWMNENAKSD